MLRTINYEKAGHISENKNTQLRKLDSLIKRETPQPVASDPPVLVYNFSNTPLDDNTPSILSKGFNFSITPRSVPIEIIITQTESAIAHLPENLAEAARQDFATTLRRAKVPKSNVTRAERQSLKNLYNNPDIVVLQADKCNATVVLKTTDYIDKLTTLLDSPEYQITARDTTVYLEQKTKALINNSNISTERMKPLIPREKSSRTPRLNGLSKIHKQNITLRPIDKYYKQVKGAPMGSPLSPVLANLYMEDVDNVFVIWPHGSENLHAFLNHINFLHPNLKFIMEVENNNSLPLLDVLITKSNNSFSHTVYRKPTHTNRYLIAKSHHHPAQLNSVLNSLIHRFIRLADNHNRSRKLY
ncbi:uncharacterized protein [Leptinotarsa decemlineata]|uniref:uncharacterized protein n=1 Tax=Leptinotarsa decemlineata TaxID=7539 RepID=UPI003D306A0D